MGTPRDTRAVAVARVRHRRRLPWAHGRESDAPGEGSEAAQAANGPCRARSLRRSVGGAEGGVGWLRLLRQVELVAAARLCAAGVTARAMRASATTRSPAGFVGSDSTSAPSSFDRWRSAVTSHRGSSASPSSSDPASATVSGLSVELLAEFALGSRPSLSRPRRSGEFVHATGVVRNPVCAHSPLSGAVESGAPPVEDLRGCRRETVTAALGALEFHQRCHLSLEILDAGHRARGSRDRAQRCSTGCRGQCLLEAFASFGQFRQLGVHGAQLISGRRERQPDRPSRTQTADDGNRTRVLSWEARPG